MHISLAADHLEDLISSLNLLKWSLISLWLQKLTVWLSDFPIIGISDNSSSIATLLLFLLLLRAEWEYLAGISLELLPPLLEVEIRLLQLEQVVAEFLSWNGSVIAVLGELLGVLKVPFHQVRLAADEESVRWVLGELEIQTLKGLLRRFTEGGVAKKVNLRVRLLEKNAFSNFFLVRIGWRLKHHL